MHQSDYSDDLERSGLKKTRHRAEILSALAISSQPLAAEQIYLALTRRGISINLSTVYRILETLTEHHMVLRLSLSGDTRFVYEYNRSVHRHYLVCLSCKKVIPIDCCPLREYERSLAEKTNYSIQGHKLDIFGTCPECLKKKAAYHND